MTPKEGEKEEGEGEEQQGEGQAGVGGGEGGEQAEEIFLSSSRAEKRSWGTREIGRNGLSSKERTIFSTGFKICQERERGGNMRQRRA